MYEPNKIPQSMIDAVNSVLNELSPDTLKSYKNKANDDIDNRIFKSKPVVGSGPAAQAAKADNDKNTAKLSNRFDGVRTAEKKLNSEEVEKIDELSKDTLKDYTKKAGDQIAAKVDGAPGQKDNTTAKTAVKRIKGIGTAFKKMNKEEFSPFTIRLIENREILQEIVKGAFHKWLGKEPDAKITSSDIDKGIAAGGHAAKMANFAKNMQHMHKEEVEKHDDEKEDKDLIKKTVKKDCLTKEETDCSSKKDDEDKDDKKSDKKDNDKDGKDNKDDGKKKFKSFKDFKKDKKSEGDE